MKTLETAAAPAQPADPQPQTSLPQTVQAALPLAPAATPANDDTDADDFAAASGVQNSQAPNTAAPVQNDASASAPATAPAQAQDQKQAQTAQAAATAPAQEQASADQPGRCRRARAQGTPAPVAQPASTPVSRPVAAPVAAKASDKNDGVKAAKPAARDANKPDTQASAKADANAAVADKPAATEGASVPKEAPAPHQAAADTNHITVAPLAAPQAQQPSQAAAPNLTQHVQVTAQPTPNVPALAVAIAAKSQSGAKQFDIRLDPPELGRVEVRLSIDATGKASAHLSADQPQTLDLLQKDAPALTRALRDAGLDVSQDGLNFSLRHQGGQDANANHGGGRGAQRSFNLSASTSIEATAAGAAYRGVADGRLDIRV